ncbi:MAG: ABC transporter substrate-binding protein [Christensenellales bacterium]
MKKICAFLLMLVLAFSVCACSRPDDLATMWYDNDEPYEIVWYFPFMPDGISTYPRDIDLIAEEVTKIIQPKINATLKLYPISLYLYNEQMPIKIGANEKFDIMYTSPHINHYYTNIERQAFLPLDNLLEEYAPETKAQVPEFMWEQARVGDYIYGLVNLQIIPRTDTVIINDIKAFNRFLKSNSETSAYDYTNIYEYILEKEIHPYDLIEDYIRYLQQTGEGLGGLMGQLSVTDSLLTRYCWDDLGTGNYVPGVVDVYDSYDDGEIKVFNQFTSEEFISDIRRAARDFTEGLIPEKIVTDGAMGTTFDQYDVVPMSTWKPNDLRLNKKGELSTVIRLGNPNYYTSFILGSMTAISSTSENPARVMKFLELLRTDAEIQNLLVFGIEGRHFTIDDKEDRPLAVNVIPNSGWNNDYMTWAYGTEFVEGLYYNKNFPDNVYEISKQINDEAHVSDVIGFNFNTTPVSAKMLDCIAIATTYLPEFSAGIHGTNIDNKYQEFINKMRIAGMDDVVAEKQKQLNEWLKSKN